MENAMLRKKEPFLKNVIDAGWLLTSWHNKTEANYGAGLLQ